MNLQGIYLVQKPLPLDNALFDNININFNKKYPVGTVIKVDSDHFVETSFLSHEEIRTCLRRLD